MYMLQHHGSEGVLSYFNQLIYVYRSKGGILITGKKTLYYKLVVAESIVFLNICCISNKIGCKKVSLKDAMVITWAVNKYSNFKKNKI